MLPLPVPHAIYLYHNLGGDANNYVVDLEFKADGARGVHHYHYGGNSIYSFGNLYQYGAHWQALTKDTIELYRHANDGYVDYSRVRIWNTPGCRTFLPLVQRE